MRGGSEGRETVESEGREVMEGDDEGRDVKEQSVGREGRGEGV